MYRLDFSILRVLFAFSFEFGKSKKTLPFPAGERAKPPWNLALFLAFFTI
jgi:hypothetical protein